MLRKFIFPTLVLFAVSAAAQTAGDPFSIALPAGFGPFAKTTQSIPSKDGTIETANWVSKTSGGEAVIVSVSTMPGKILDPAKMMSSTRDALLKSVKGTLDSEESIAGEHPGSRLFLHSGTTWVRARLVVLGDKLYQLVYVGHSAEQRTAPPVAQMFASFQAL